jgi:hypothetical protein
MEAIEKRGQQKRDNKHRRFLREQAKKQNQKNVNKCKCRRIYNNKNKV